MIIEEATKNYSDALGSSVLLHDEKLIRSLADVVRSDIQLIKAFKAFITNSKYGYLEATKIAAINAISILVAGNIPFVDEDFTNIKIPGANLRDGVFTNCDFTGAILSGVCMKNCKMQACNLSKAILKDIDLGLYGGIALFENISGLKISPERPEGHLLMSIHKFNKKICIWDYITREKCEEIHGQEGSFSPAGSEFAVAHDKNLQIWKFWKEYGKNNNKLMRTLEGHTQDITVIEFGWDGSEIFTGSLDKNIILWSIKAGTKIAIFEGHEDQVSCLAFNHQNSLLVSGSFDHSIIIWDKDTGKQLKKLLEHEKPINCVKFFKNGEQFMSASDDPNGNLKVWQSKTGAFLQSFQGYHFGGVKSLSFSKSGNLFVSVGKDSVSVINYFDKNIVFRSEIPENVQIFSAIFSPDDKRIILGGDDKIITFRDITTAKYTKVFDGAANDILSVALSPDASFIAAGLADNSLRLWSSSNGKLVKTFVGHTNEVNAIVFSQDNSTVLSGGRDKICVLWNRKNGKIIDTYKVDQPVMAVTFGQENTFICGCGNNLKLFNISPKKSLASFEGHTDLVTSIAYSSNGNRIISGSLDKSIILWNFHGSIEKIFEAHTGPVTSVSFSPDGYKSLSSSLDKTIKVWENESGTILKNFTVHNEEVNCACYSPDGNKILSGGFDNKIKISSESTESEVNSFTGHLGHVTHVGFSLDGRTIFSAGKDNVIRLWQKTSKEGSALPLDFYLGLEISADETPMKFTDTVISDAVDLSEFHKQILIKNGAQTYFF